MSTFRPTIDPAYREKMKAMAMAVDEFFNGDKRGNDREVGFCLLVFPFAGLGDPGQERINYISNADRANMITAMKELIGRFEGRDHDPVKTKQ
jgi:hypothetical protein